MENNKFEYNYTAPTDMERREIESIRRNYVDCPSDVGGQLERLRILDGKVKNFPTAISLVLGVLGILVFGAGMALVLEYDQVLWGVLLGVLGIIPTALAYPVYKKTYEKRKAKYKEEILSLTEKLLGEK